MCGKLTASGFCDSCVVSPLLSYNNTEVSSFLRGFSGENVEEAFSHFLIVSPLEPPLLNVTEQGPVDALR